MSNRRYGAPMVIPMAISDGAASRPRRVPLNLRRIEERWLQERIRVYPELLPVDEIEPVFAPLIPIGFEVPTAVGPIDNLYISPSGYVTIVETKLWRNPEARREVVGQIIDYAKELRRWSFQDLERAVQAYNKQHEGDPRGIIETIKLHEQLEEPDEKAIVDTISRNLERGMFLLLIVGDGIRESVEAMAEFLAGTPQLHFTPALVELELYEMDGRHGQLLVIPHVVARTREVTRAVVRVERAAIIDIHTPPPPPRPPRSPLTEEDFFSKLSKRVAPEEVQFARQVIEDMQNRGCVIDWKQASYVVKLPDPGGSGRLLTLFVVTKDDQVYVGWLQGQLRSLGLPESIAPEFAKDSADLFGLRIQAKTPDFWLKNVTLKQLRAKYEQFASLVQRTIDKVKSASDGESP